MTGSLSARADAERVMHREIAMARRRRRIIEAGTLDPEALSAQGRNTLRWLSEWDEWTTDGLLELLAAARAAGGLPEDRVRQRQEAARREESAAMDAAVGRYNELLGGPR
ncbi:MAG: hypothetical protein ACRD2C_26505 [Acidimicrobiales bacterium]